jgi:hypothetical protein
MDESNIPRNERKPKKWTKCDAILTQLDEMEDLYNKLVALFIYVESIVGITHN